MVELATLQAVSYIMGSLGVFVAAVYYVYNMRNAERDRRKQIILQKLPPFNIDYYTTYLTLNWSLDFQTPEEFYEKYARNIEIEPKIWHIMNIYNTLGILYQEGLMSLDDIAKLYTPLWIMTFYEQFNFLFKRSRYDEQGEPLMPDAFVPFEQLYLALKNKHPSVESLIERFRAENRKHHESLKS